MNLVFLAYSAASAIFTIVAIRSDFWFLAPVFAWCAWEYWKMAAE